MHRPKIKPYAKKDLKENIEEFLEQLGFVCISHPSSLYKKIYKKDNLTIRVEEKPKTETMLNS